MKRLMKALAAALLISALLLAAACSAPEPEPMPERPFSLYYRAASAPYGAESGVFVIRQIDLGEENADISSILLRYFTPGEPENCISPFPADTEILSASILGSSAIVRLGGGYADLNGINATVSDSCIAKTLFQIPGIEKVRIVVESRGGANLRDRWLYSDSIMLHDDSAEISTVSFVLYFAQTDGNCLVSERRSAPAGREVFLPEYVITELLSGPEKAGLRSAIPEGTTLLDIGVEDGVCSVDFSEEFLENKPESSGEEWLSVLSVVNTLSELEGVNAVRIYVGGNAPERYVYLPMNLEFVSDQNVIGPMHKDMYETQVDICLPLSDSGLLYRFPAKLKCANGERAEQALLNMLLGYSAGNGLDNPLSGLTGLAFSSVENGCCILTCGETDVPLLTEQALRALTCTLTGLDNVKSIAVRRDGETLLLPGPDGIPVEQLRPAPEWFCENARD